MKEGWLRRRDGATRGSEVCRGWESVGMGKEGEVEGKVMVGNLMR